MLAHASHTRVPHLAHYIHLPPLTRIPKFLLGEVPRLGLDRAGSRGFVALTFLLFRDSFEGNTATFLAVGRAAGLSRSVIRSLPSVSGRRGGLPMPSINSKGHNHLSDVRHPPTRVPGKTSA